MTLASSPATSSAFSRETSAYDEYKSIPRQISFSVSLNSGRECEGRCCRWDDQRERFIEFNALISRINMSERVDMPWRISSYTHTPSYWAQVDSDRSEIQAFDSDLCRSNPVKPVGLHIWHYECCPIQLRRRLALGKVFVTFSAKMVVSYFPCQQKPWRWERSTEKWERRVRPLLLIEIAGDFEMRESIVES